MTKGTKSFFQAFLIFITINGLLITTTLQVSAEAPGLIVVIGSDTVWTKADSPHTLTGPVLVNQGVTLTIEAGANVNVNGYYISVNGTLRVLGNATDKVHIINCEEIEFTEFSSDWNEETGSGCIIEHAVLNSTKINVDGVSPKISNNVLEDSEIVVTIGGSPVISYNILTNGKIFAGSSTLISHNTLTNWGISVARGSISSGFPEISNNTINGGETGIYCSSGYANISGNNVSGCKWGIVLSTEQVFGGSWPSFAIVKRNLIINNDWGINIALGSRFSAGTATPTILNNTITDNLVGIHVSQSNYEASPIITYNNIHNNSDYNLQLSECTTNNVNAIYNWWGTTDTQAINLTIHDYKYDFELGKVNFLPLLAEPNSEATSDPIPEFSLIIILPIFLVATFVVALYRKRLT